LPSGAAAHRRKAWRCSCGAACAHGCRPGLSACRRRCRRQQRRRMIRRPAPRNCTPTSRCCWPAWFCSPIRRPSHDERCPSEGASQSPQAQRLPVRASVDAAAGLREHREHQAPVRLAPARGGAWLGRGAHRRDRHRPRPVRRLVGPRGLPAAGGRGRHGACLHRAGGWRSRGWRATRWTGIGCWRFAR